MNYGFFMSNELLQSSDLIYLKKHYTTRDVPDEKLIELGKRETGFTAYTLRVFAKLHIFKKNLDKYYKKTGLQVIKNENLAFIRAKLNPDKEEEKKLEELFPQKAFLTDQNPQFLRIRTFHALYNLKNGYKEWIPAELVDELRLKIAPVCDVGEITQAHLNQLRRTIELCKGFCPFSKEAAHAIQLLKEEDIAFLEQYPALIKPLKSRLVGNAVQDAKAILQFKKEFQEYATVGDDYLYLNFCAMHENGDPRAFNLYQWEQFNTYLTSQFGKSFSQTISKLFSKVESSYFKTDAQFVELESILKMLERIKSGNGNKKKFDELLEDVGKEEETPSGLLSFIYRLHSPLSIPEDMGEMKRLYETYKRIVNKKAYPEDVIVEAISKMLSKYSLEQLVNGLEEGALDRVFPSKTGSEFYSLCKELMESRHKF